jgi:hypothetical protein
MGILLPGNAVSDIMNKPWVKKQTKPIIFRHFFDSWMLFFVFISPAMLLRPLFARAR